MNLKSKFVILFVLIGLFTQAKDIGRLLNLDKEDFPETLSKHDTINNEVFRQASKLIDSLNIGSQKASFNGSVLVAYQGKVLFEKAYGVSDKSTGILNTLDTPTQLASITKTFTASAVLKLYENELIDIYRPVQSYLWEFPYFDITVEQLLSHRSGLPDYLSFSKKYWKWSDPMYNDDLLDIFMNNNFQLEFTPGTKFDYCNSNYAILGLLIEAVTGKTYKEFMETELFAPLHMNSSYVFDPALGVVEGSAKSYRKNFAPWKNTHQDGVYADKGIFSTVQDLYKWHLALESSEFLSEETKRIAYTPTSPWEVKKNYGLGWRIKCFPNEEKYVYHTGWWHGYQGVFSRYIQDDFTIVILSNRFINGISDNSEKIYAACQPLLNLTELS